MGVLIKKPDDEPGSAWVAITIGWSTEPSYLKVISRS